MVRNALEVISNAICEILMQRSAGSDDHRPREIPLYLPYLPAPTALEPRHRACKSQIVNHKSGMLTMTPDPDDFGIDAEDIPRTGTGTTSIAINAHHLDLNI